MEYTTTRINTNYRIKVYGMTDGGRIDKLVGVSGLLNLIGRELSDKLVRRAFESKEDKTICKLRRGIKITFYSK